MLGHGTERCALWVSCYLYALLLLGCLTRCSTLPCFEGCPMHLGGQACARWPPRLLHMHHTHAVILFPLMAKRQSAGAVRKHAPARGQEGVGGPLHQVARQEVLRLALRGKVNKHSAFSVLSVQRCDACAIAAECAPIQAGRVASRPRPLILTLSSAVR